jgi:molybdate transport system ATP-binding protein
MTVRVAVEKALGAFTLAADFTSSGRLTALFGRSGSGKTTLVNLIAGLARPDRGRISVDELVLFDDVAGVDLPAHRRRVGYVFQEGRLFPHMTVRSNLLYGRRRSPATDHFASLDVIVDLLGIGGLLDRRPANLSGGEKQRVAIGRALLSSPRLLLMDEPLASLDAARKADILPYIERLRDEMKLPIIYVSHAVDEVARLADIVVVLADGKVAAGGPVEQIFSRLDLETVLDRENAGAIIHGKVVAHDGGAGMTRLSHPAGELFHPLLSEPVGATVALRVRARDVALAVGDPGLLSIRNRLSCVIAEIAEGPPPAVDIRLDAGGEALLARITRDAAAALDLSLGLRVTALIKTVSFNR